MIDQLEEIVKEAPDLPVYFDMERKHPTHFASWRGAYSELTLCPGDDRDPIKVQTAADLLERAQQCLWTTFNGYKGGEYRMDRDTAIYADPWGVCDNRFIIKVVWIGGQYPCVLLRTFLKPPEYIW